MHLTIVVTITNGFALHTYVGALSEHLAITMSSKYFLLRNFLMVSFDEFSREK